MHQVEWDMSVTQLANSSLQLPRSPDLAPSEESLWIELHARKTMAEDR
jgi:hypothetical protein